VNPVFRDVAQQEEAGVAAGFRPLRAYP